MLLCAAGLVRAEDEPAAARWWPEAVAQALERAGTNGTELRRALDEVPGAQRESMQFLLENMPARDLRGLSAGFLLTEVAQATDARLHAPWAGSVPTEIFLNDVLPYANAGERRDPWRADLRARCLPLVEGCATAGAAAQRINETLFGAVKVRYSTERARADQSPAESMASGLASCTGLSILLVDACRSVGVPARLAGIPDWIDGRGNHTWVEIWDAGKWHFVGAAEPDKRGLDHAWFERDAALAQKDAPRHAIYAVSFRHTGLPFPLAWGPDSGEVSAENVTERYTTGGGPGEAAGTARVMVRVTAEGGKRVAATVRVAGITDSTVERTGTSKGENADLNDLLSFDLPHGQTFNVKAEQEGMGGEKRVVVEPGAQQIVEVALRPLNGLEDFFAAPAERQATWKFDPALEAALQEQPEVVRQMAWEAYRRAPIHAETAADFAANRVRFEGYESPYTLRRVGEKPAGGWGLVIAMHGGGGAPKEVNDSQWRIMQSYYHDQPGLGGYLYLALRAPNDTWNGFYDDYVYPLVSNLIRQVAVAQDVDLDRVYLIGYSHGGYGAFAIGPKMPDRFAAIHSSAAAPTDGLISPKTLRNTAFDFAVGEFDDAYGRRERCEAFARAVQELRGSRTDIFPVTFTVQAGRHHSDLPDHDQLREMLPHRRNPVPRELTWEETDGVIKDFYWLSDPQPEKGREIDATCRENRLAITAHPAKGRFSVWLDERLVDFRQPLVVAHDGVEESLAIAPGLAVLCATLAERGDVGLAFSCRVECEVDAEGKMRVAAGMGTRP